MKLFVSTRTAANRIQKLAKLFNALGSNSTINGDHINFLNLDLVYFNFNVANSMWESAEKKEDIFLSIDFYHSTKSNESSAPLDKESNDSIVKDSLIDRVKDKLFNNSIKTRISHRCLDDSSIASINDTSSNTSTASDHVIDINLKELVLPCGSNNEYLDYIENGLVMRYNPVDKLPNIYHIAAANVYLRLIPSNTLSLLFEVNSLENMKVFFRQNNLIYEEISYDQLNKTNQLILQVSNIQIRFIARNQSLTSYWVENNNTLLENTIKEIQHHHVAGESGETGGKKHDGTDCWHEFRYILRKQPHKFLQ